MPYGVVVLNYNNYIDTIEFINSVRLYDKRVPVVVVDNGSSNDSYQRIKLLESHLRINCIRIDINQGFAKGMNVGIKYLRRMGIDNIFCANSDIIVHGGIFESLYELNSDKIGVIGPRIIQNQGQDQSPILDERPSFFRAVRILLVYSWAGYVFNSFISLNTKRKKNKQNPISKKVYAVHGAFFLLTSNFFRYYTSLSDKTFLYGEELILGEMCYQKGLEQYFADSYCVYHKGKGSTDTKSIRSKINTFRQMKKSVQAWFFSFYLKGNTIK